MTTDHQKTSQKPSDEELKDRKIAVACGLFLGAVVGATAVGLIRPVKHVALTLSQEQAQALIADPKAHVHFPVDRFREIVVYVTPQS